MKSLDELYTTRTDAIWISTNEADAEAPAFQCAIYDPATPYVATVLNKHSRKYRAQIRTEQLSAEKDREIAVRTFVECSMKGWRNVSLDGKVALEFTVDNAVAVFTKYHRMFAFVTSEAQRENNYKLSEDDTKN